MEKQITLPELESAINYWRQQSPSIGEELRLCKEASALATPYALMILSKRQSIQLGELDERAQKAYEAWTEVTRPAG
jgi:hypothetical protein